ncbi:MAG: GNAT family N-acetyltransferase [Thermoanaerobaculia bacterium]|nr:GNAT family N-acetyltransferase [Thermoanaerobaculia bacterium]
MKTAVTELRDAVHEWVHSRGDAAAMHTAALHLLSTVETLLESGRPQHVAAADWHEYLEVTGHSSFLQSLPNLGARERWAETAFRVIRVSDYSLRTLLEARARVHPERILFEDGRELDSTSWSYAQVARYVRSIAGAFLTAQPGAPRVAIFCENGVDGACADLACLTEGILVTPLNVHFDTETIAWIFARLDINIVVTDSEERLARLAEVRQKSGREFRVFHAGSRATATTVQGLESEPLRKACSRLDLAAVEALLSGRHPDIMAPATVMFTSGSTGRPKGVVFSQYNLVSKRFARAAALPAVGENEVLLCFLPLFHTFGRYLEMLGMIYWGGTYIFAGSPSAESLIADMGRVRPTGLISIPIRWTQIRDHCLEAMDRAGDAETEEAVFREIVGGRLRWGLSAAGYLDPKVFRFFQRHGVDLCSGFGMTEATGGITMTPPGEYVDASVGVPLPGLRARLSEAGELQISGPYVARYLDEHGAPASLPDCDPDAEHWVATGDLFAERPNGYLEIIDRIKDIYKNSRGQTVAPQRVEQRFEEVPGFRRVFLAGDHRDHNVLLVVPDRSDPVLEGRSEEDVLEYLGQIVASANAGLAPYERVVRFAVLDRDFDAERDELTPKGSFRRKVIEAHFAETIEKLYASNHVDLVAGPLLVRVPRWFFRDLGVLEDDIVATDGGIRNRRSELALRVARESDGSVRVGDLAYRIPGDVVDLGLFARQPRLWVGNAAFAAFSPCKPGWELPLRGVSEKVRIPKSAPRPAHVAGRPRLDDDRLRAVHALCIPALFGDELESREAVEQLGHELGRVDERTASVIHRRLEALAYRPEEEIRALAYRVLLLDESGTVSSDAYATFLESGQTYLTPESIALIASARRGERRLQSLRHRLYNYRTTLEWPAAPARRRQFERSFRLLADFARHDREYFPTVQSELACWALFHEDPALARKADRAVHELADWYRGVLAESAVDPESARPIDKVVFEYGIPQADRAQLEKLLFERTFLVEAIARAFGDQRFSWSRVAPDGLWVSPMLSQHQLHIYRLGINLADGRHYDLLLVMGKALRRAAIRETVRWLTALSGHVVGAPVFPRFGVWRRDLGAMAVAYVSDLTAWERVRELSSQRDVRDAAVTAWSWRRLFVRSMTAFFRGWEQSGFRIVPGSVTPENVALPDADFHETANILSIAGWRPYAGPLSLVRPLLRSFYRLTEAHYPHSRAMLRPEWIFEACIEALGEERAQNFFDMLESALSAVPASADTEILGSALARFRAGLAERPYIPLPVHCAIHRYLDWERTNMTASFEAREEAVIQMVHLYRFERFPEAYRYYVYQHTYFKGAGARVHEAFDRLIARRLGDTHALPGHLEELSTLQGLLTDPGDRDVFSRMVFPMARRAQKLELYALGETAGHRVIVRSEIRDESGSPYVVREPISPAEIGHLYRLLLETDYPKHVAEHDLHLVITDEEERIVGGLCYRWQEAGSVYVDGIVVADSLTNHGLGGRLLEDFCVRMAAQGAHVAKTNFFLGRLFAKHGFQVNQRWGGLVRFLDGE